MNLKCSKTMKIRQAHLLFEQSGTFKNEFLKLGFPAYDYDICNDFGQTDFVVDLLDEIHWETIGVNGLFSRMTPDDIVFAFFPCTYFCENNVMFFCGTNKNYRGKSKSEVLQLIKEREEKRHTYYTRLIELIKIAEDRHLRLIIENPYSPHHYWRFNLPYHPAIIDMNRQRKGDYYKKPTQYLFINCTPGQKNSLQYDKPRKFVNKNTTINRSMISPDYARNFICDNILEIETKYTVKTLF